MVGSGSMKQVRTFESSQASQSVGPMQSSPSSALNDYDEVQISRENREWLESNQKNAPLTGWKLRLSQVVEITALFLIAVGLLRNVAEMVTDGALKGFPYVTLGSLLVFIASHRLSGRSFLPQKDSGVCWK